MFQPRGALCSPVRLNVLAWIDDITDFGAPWRQAAVANARATWYRPVKNRRLPPSYWRRCKKSTEWKLESLEIDCARATESDQGLCPLPGDCVSVKYVNCVFVANTSRRTKWPHFIAELMFSVINLIRHSGPLRRSKAAGAFLLFSVIMMLANWTSVALAGHRLFVKSSVVRE